MTEVFQRSSVVQAWLAGIRHLESQNSHDATNIILEIISPQAAGREDRQVVDAVSHALRQRKSARTVMTAAGTLFPQAIYKRYGRPDWYARYKSIIEHSMAPHTWGTYAMRMIERKDENGATFNPLDKIIEKLIAIRTKKLNKYVAAYELGVCDPIVDLSDEFNGCGFELPTYDPSLDRHKYYGSACLSHVTFKLMHGRIDLTAIYRSHHYAERALGNLIGLAQLQQYVAKESGYNTGTLTCISTYAKLDSGLGGIRATSKLLETFPIDEKLIKETAAAI
ncbi:hypothetical protein [Pseudomonas cichorii]|uniref:hypothetical protein n=1 Tax=Pseudomonas cichorii TaxID=36746 RepID=UPI001C896289|nr:hypothetical protein [Pseudomonas cichorii]MBX8493287.1 hypothetical protein [Pseudomonas cichorii]